MHGKG
jgi:hypothetical protein